MTHPLTDEICERISRRCVSVTTSIERDNMRAAADWQLEQVIEWLDERIADIDYHDGFEAICLSYSILYDRLKKAMRPTTQENN